MICVVCDELMGHVMPGQHWVILGVARLYNRTPALVWRITLKYCGAVVILFLMIR